MSSPLRTAVLAFCAAGLFATSAHGQAWVGEQHSLSLRVNYNYDTSDTIIEDFADRSDELSIFDMDNHIFVFGAEYNPLDQWAISATVPIISSRYSGSQLRGLAHGRYDDGSYHTTLQDFRLDTRYQVLNDPVAIAPHLGFSVPMTDYENVGFAAAGRGLKQLHLGASVGKFFLEGIPGLYLHGRYSFNLSERYDTTFDETSDYGRNSSDFAAQVGYFVLDDLEVHLAGDLRISHGGFAFEDQDEVGAITRYYHDPLLDEDFLLLGLGSAYQIRDDLRVSAMFRMWTWGHNSRNTKLFGLGVDWSVL